VKGKDKSTIKHRMESIVILLVLTGYFFAIGKISGQGISVSDSLKNDLLKSWNTESKIKTLLRLSTEIESFDNNKAIQYALQANSLSQETQSDSLKTACLNRIGASYIAIDDFISALKYTEEAKALGEEHKIIREVAIAIGNLAIIYEALGDYKRRSEYDFQSLKLFEQIGDKYNIGIRLGNIGIDFYNLGEYEKALEYLFKSLKIAQEINDQHGVALQFNSMAGVYLEIYKDYGKALVYYKDALAISRQSGNKRLEGTVLLNIGDLFSTTQQNDSSIYYYYSALDILNELNSPHNLAWCLIKIGQYYSNAGNPEQSLKYSLTALKIGQENNLLEVVLNSSAILHNVYLQNNDFENAYKYSLVENRAQDSIYSQQNQKDLLKLEFQYNLEKLEKQRQIQQQRRNFFIGFIFFGLITGIVIVVLINSRQRIKVKNALLENQSISSELNFKNKELSINLMALIKKNEMLADISNNLIELEKEAKTSETKLAIDKISKKIRHNSDDKLLKEFSTRFQEVHEGFYDALLKKYPDLTQNELKLCAFLKLNMSSKDISELTGQSIFALENARYRLRKKLGISNSNVNLVTFLSQI
jgi:tetratricopeptide (TPR) repeat protein